MSKANHLNASYSMYPMDNAGPIWRAGIKDNVSVINEGDDVTFILQLLNRKAGAQTNWGMTVWSGEGTVISDNNWVEGLVPVFRREITKAGLTFQLLDLTTTPARNFTLNMLIGYADGSTYDGRIIEIKLTARRNRQDDVSPRRSQCVLMKTVDTAPTPSTLRGFGGNNLSIIDTSKKPTGAPTFRMDAFNLNGVDPAKVNYSPGDGFLMRISTTNMIPGTKVKIYAANTAQYWLKPSFRDALLKALREQGPAMGLSYEETRYPPPAGQAWYNGYTLVFGPNWDNTKTLDIPLIFSQVADDGTPTQIDFLTRVMAEGTAADFDTTRNAGNWDKTQTYSKGDIVTYVNDGGLYIALQGVGQNLPPDTSSQYWRFYQPLQVLAGGITRFAAALEKQYWQIRAVSTDKQTIKYALRVPINTGSETIQLSTANVHSSFLPAIVAAAAASGSPATFDGVNTFTTAPPAQGIPASANIAYIDLTWSTPYVANGGVQTLSLMNSSKSPITIGDTMVAQNGWVQPADPTYITGVSMSGGDFGAVPGIYGTDYRYPDSPEAAAPNNHLPMDYLWNIGIRFLRLPTRWSRIQRTQFGPLSGEKPDPTSPWNDAYDIARCDLIVNYWTSLGGIIMFDVHNYGARGSDGNIGWDQKVPVTALNDLWIKLANRYKNNVRVWFELMNEPTGVGWSPTRCRENFQWLVNLIRMTGATNKILIGGQGYSSAKDWVGSGQGDAYLDFYDPMNNFAFTPHCYFDGTSGGQVGVCVPSGQNRMQSVLDWGKLNGFKIFIGEIAGGDPANKDFAECGNVLPAAYNLLKTHPASLGFSVWGYGPRWPQSYVFYLNPTDYMNYVPQAAGMKIYAPFIEARY